MTSAERVNYDDVRYPTLIRGFNQRFSGQPRYIDVVSDTVQVENSLQSCVDAGMRPVVRSSGHAYEGWSVLTDGVIIDVSGLRRAGRDPKTRWFFLEPGCTNWDVYDQIYRRYGRTLPAGSCYSVAAGGHICGGGYGLLSRLHGLTVDWLTAVEVVHVDRSGKARRVLARKDSSDDRERDLFWAHTGGGGGNFGIVTRYFFADLPLAPNQATLASVAWEWSELHRNPAALPALLRNFGAFFEANSAPGSEYSSLFALLHLTRRAAGQVVLTIQNAGGARGPVDTAPVRDLIDAMHVGVDTNRVRPVAPRITAGWHNNVSAGATTMRSMPWLEVTQTLNGSGANQRGKYKSAYMKRGFTEDQIDVVRHWLSVQNSDYPPNKDALLQVDSYGGAINAVASDATAIPQRSSVLKLQYQTYWGDPEGDAANLAWIRRFYHDMYGPRGPWPDADVDGCYVNYPDTDLGDWQYLYYKTGYRRLQAVKAEWDPNNVFRHDQSVELPAT